MKQRILLPLILCLVSMPGPFAQISNTETTITLSSGPFAPVCTMDPPPGSTGNVYQMYVVFQDMDNFGVSKRLPATGYYNCTVTNTPNVYGPNIFINVPTAVFPMPWNTLMEYDFTMTMGKVYLVNTSIGITYYQNWQYDQYACPL